MAAENVQIIVKNTGFSSSRKLEFRFSSAPEQYGGDPPTLLRPPPPGGAGRRVWEFPVGVSIHFEGLDGGPYALLTPPYDY